MDINGVFKFKNEINGWRNWNWNFKVLCLFRDFFLEKNYKRKFVVRRRISFFLFKFWNKRENSFFHYPSNMWKISLSVNMTALQLNLSQRITFWSNKKEVKKSKVFFDKIIQKSLMIWLLLHHIRLVILW